MSKLKLGDVITKATVEKCGNGTYPVLSMTMHDGIVFQDDRFKKRIASKDQSAYNVVRRDQLVVGFPIDEGVLSVQDIIDAGIVSPAYRIWNIDQDVVVPQYLELLLRSPHSIQYYKSKLKGSTARRRSITDDDFLAIELPSHDLKEQFQIVRVIDGVSSLAKLERAKLSSLDQLVKSRFIEMFGGGVYEAVPLGDLLTSISDGTHKTPNYLDGGIKFISAKNITPGKLDLTDVKFISEDEYAEIQRRCRTEQGDILLSKSGSLGMPIVLETDEPLGLFESLAVLKFDHGVLEPHFLCEQLRSDSVQEQFKGSSKGVAVKHLHLNVIKAVRVVVPPIELQREFADFVAQVDKSRFAVQKAIEQLELLKASLMQEYFG